MLKGNRLQGLCVALLFFGCTAAFAQKTTVKFDFGSGKVAKGFTGATAKDVYSEAKGYGFEPATPVTAVDRGSKDALKGDFVTSEKPFYFSVKVPEGNYKVTVTLGDPKGKSATTVKAESRRLMLENIQTQAGQSVSKTFIVHIKDRKINDTKQVSLKPRELTKLDWDNKLTLEFSQKPALAAVEITKVEDQITVFLAGNSTVVNQEDEPWASWGQMIPRFFKPGVAIANHAESGLSLGSFIGSHRLEKILSVLKLGDYVFVEFGHNDEKEKGPNAGPYKSYTERLRLFASEVKSKGGHLVILTPTARRSFNEQGDMTNSHGDYPDAAKKVAEQEKVPLIDLTAHTTTLYETLGVEGSKNAFVIYPEQNLNDNTHFNPYGAYQIAKMVAEGIKAHNLNLAAYLQELPTYDPKKPDPFKNFNWPPSPSASLLKPDGN
ncbi:rhamnogalacturonan acetylesterase [Rufibacter glacialis]|uniref:Rhamnogalacturonan acetylesterase n=1 Tax=Rufibacter glacialis TaxID=1259555 RepID=A0A5M8QB04_9BACT|nr:GDSL-type esterase/lipase family protein [Rufibacter glacialis]KAA6432338.1 rhamnogalacturonan acetylesterase [Rufibacter glacialis]GGK77855.1 rhamnogalacturonan acetylesterase [Rufibacter glacialis]